MLFIRRSPFLRGFANRLFCKIAPQAVGAADTQWTERQLKFFEQHLGEFDMLAR